MMEKTAKQCKHKRTPTKYVIHTTVHTCVRFMYTLNEYDNMIARNNSSLKIRKLRKMMNRKKNTFKLTQNSTKEKKN